VEGTPAEALPPETEEFKFSDETTPETPPEKAAEAPPPPSDYEGEAIPPEEVRKLESAFLRTNRGRRALSALKSTQELEKDPNQGGIGFVPTAPQVKEFFQDSSDLRTMADEFHSAHPAEAANWIAQWFGPDQEGKIAPGARAVVEQLIPTLTERAPDLAVALSLQAVENYKQELLKYAWSQPNETIKLPNGGTFNPRLHWASIALNIEHHLTGKEFTPEDIQRLTLQFQGQPPEGMVSSPTAEVDAKLARIERFEREQSQQARNEFSGKLKTECESGVLADVQEALKPVEGKLPSLIHGAVQEKFLAEVQARIRQNLPGLREYARLRDAAFRSKSEADMQAAARAWRNLARPAIKQLRLGYLRDASDLMKQRSDERHATAQAAQGQAGPANLAQPTAQSVLSADAMKRREGETAQEHLLRLTRESFQRSGIV
jgi:hypothetical protein